jgi:hypothetical protein
MNEQRMSEYGGTSTEDRVMEKISGGIKVGFGRVFAEYGSRVKGRLKSDPNGICVVFRETFNLFLFFFRSLLELFIYIIFI